MKKAYALALGDTHTGATRALLPPGCRRHTGEDENETEKVTLTILQKYLWSRFQTMIREIHHYTSKFVLLNLGDMLQGFRDVWATKLTLPMFNDQVDAHVMLEGELVKAGAIAAFLCHGTNYHKQPYCDHEMEVAKRIRRAEVKEEGFNGIRCRYSDKFNIKILGKTLNILHSHSTVQDYPSTPMDKEIEGSWLKEALKQAPHADIIVRGHIHPTTFAANIRDNKIGFFNLCWQLPDDYLTTRKARYYRSLPLLGAVLIEITEEPMPHGVRLIPLKYPPPKGEMRVESVKW